MTHLIVDFASTAQELSRQCRLGQEQRVDRNAVTTNATARLQNVDAGMMVGQLDDLIHILAIRCFGCARERTRQEGGEEREKEKKDADWSEKEGVT